jgi:hypothetical protein
MDKAFFFGSPATVPDDISAKLHKKRIAVTLPRLFTIRMTLFVISSAESTITFFISSRTALALFSPEETDFLRRFAPLKTRALAFFNRSPLDIKKRKGACHCRPPCEYFSPISLGYQITPGATAIPKLIISLML